MKKLLTILLAMLMVLSLAACGSKEPTDGGTDAPVEEIAKYEAMNGDVKMILIGGQGGTFWGPIEESFRKACAEKGWQCDFAGVTDADNSQYLEKAESALAQGYNVIACVINDMTIFDEFVQRATDQGVLVLAFNSAAPEDHREWVPAMVGMDGYTSGHQQGEKIAQFAKERGLTEINYYVGLVAQNVDSNWKNVQGCLDAIHEELGADFPCNELGVSEAKGNSANAQDNFNALYVAHPEVNCIFVVDAYSGVGASAFVEENGLEGQLIVCGLELSADAFRRIQNGSWTAASFVDVEWMGDEIVQLAEKILKEQPYEPINYAPKLWVVTQEEIDAYCEAHGIEM